MAEARSEDMRTSPENLKTDYPSVFMTIPDYLQKSSPKKRKTNKSQQVSGCLLTNVKESGKKDDRNYDTDEEMEVDTDYSVSVAMQFEQLTRELEVKIDVSTTTVSSIFITWVKLMLRELSALIVWPSPQQFKKTLPSCFIKLYPKVRCIIDCFEYFTETPCGLDLAATLWSEYKHHYPFKVLAAFAPNGAISDVSSC
ncbi:hypothetical protein P5673_012520 [Acropora cervicornis]|uniref:DDE Tnp4 domain-containing protein n=1 Tax=Acropora cervicornis TaxID=6130 RepID=A0AAD9QNL5_ACRCE|nr:hypothetical protein P5673_012520 [Acropora cervicornis]